MSTTPAITIDSRLDGDALATIGDDVGAGLGAGPPYTLPPKYFYDERGSELFDQITELPEYYPTRAERAILNRHPPAIVERTGARAPVERCADELSELYPGLEVHGLIGDFERDLVHLPEPRDRRLVAFLGGTIGNLDPAERARFLVALAELLGPDDRLLLGTDLVKDPGVLQRAYDDAAGITAAFNLNVLTVLNRELDGDFDVGAWSHVARWDADEEWIEMRLRTERDQRVELPGAGIAVDFRAGDEIRTEISAKFTRERIESELGAASLEAELLLTDPDGLFALTLARPASG